MRSLRLRFGLRTLLVVVAVCAAAMGIWRRAEAFKRAAAAHDREAQMYADVAWGMERFGIDVDKMQKVARGELDPDSVENLRWAAKYWSLHEEHRRLAEEHRRAGWVPAP